jgi:hypothetical protein
MSGGMISRDGQILTRIGRSFTVSDAGPARKRITFDLPFTKRPVALIAAYQDANPTTARVDSIDERSLVVETAILRGIIRRKPHSVLWFWKA